MLKEENSYGYELMERIEEDFGFEQISPGSVYRTLRLSLRFNPNGRLAVRQPRIPRMEAPDRR